MNRQVVFVLNLSLLIGLLVVGALLVVLLIASWTGVKIGLWHWRIRRDQRAARSAALARDGRPYPPSGRGLCQSCGAIGPVVHPADGSKLCRACYDARGNLGDAPPCP